MAGRIHGDKGRVGRLKPLEKDTGAQPRVLGLQKQCKREGIPLGLDGFHPFDERDEVHLGKATFGFFAPLLDDKMIPADKFLEGLSCRLGQVPVKLQEDVVPDEAEGPERKPPFIAIVDHNTGGEDLIHLLGEFLHGAPLFQTKLHQFTLAGKAQRKGEGNGDIRVGVEPCRVADGDSRPEKGPLHGVHEIQVGDVLGSARFGEKDSLIRHGKSLLRTDGWRRSRNISPGSQG